MAMLRHLQLVRYAKSTSENVRSFASGGTNTSETLQCGEQSVAVVTGVYLEGGNNIKLTKTAQLLDERLGMRITNALKMTPPYPAIGEVRELHGLHPLYSSIAVAGLGPECVGYNEQEQLDERKEVIRQAAGAGVKALSKLSVDRILVDDFGHAESAAEGASMAAFVYQEFKSLTKRRRIPRVDLFNSCDFTGWQIGLHKAAAQNLARHLQEAPANHLTPQMFAQSAIELLSKYNINVEVRMPHWAKLRNLNAFLAAGKGACDPIFLEVFYEGCDPDVCPAVLIGKGLTFNSGGLCLNSCHGMQHMRGDVAGAATVIAALRAVAALKLPINVRALVPLCTNMPGASAVKPGDAVKAYNGKTILIHNPNCEGLLLHADALSYAAEYNPKFILDIGTLTLDTYGSIGEAATLAYSNNESLYETMRIASIHTGDRIWRFPLWSHFTDFVKSNTTDLTNKVPKLIGAGSSKAAAFLNQFVPPKTDWIHLDIQNVFYTDGLDYTYLSQGMSGRPTRNLVEFLAQMACHHSK